MATNAFLPLSLALDSLANATNGDPFAVLGPHAGRVDGQDTLVLRTLQLDADRVDVLRLDEAREPVSVTRMQRVHPAGIYESAFPNVVQPFRYRFRVSGPDGRSRDIEDPYRFPRVMGDVDLHLLGEGNHLRMWERLGSHVMMLDGVEGTYFSVWAPNADRVSVVGEWNQWDGRMHPMRVLFPNGIWELFIPGVDAGSRYKFEIRSRLHGAVFLKADPCAQYAEVPPATASVVWQSNRYEWRDRDWMAHRAQAGAWRDRPMAVYEVHLGSWRHHPDGRVYSYRDLARELVSYVKDMGFTHIELMPVLEHPSTGPGDTRLPASSRPRRVSARRRTSSCSSTHAINRGSASFSTGFPAISRRTRTRWPDSTARRCTSTRIHGRANIRIGAR
jgi:1,4-alpha-glucan branching enzyme